MEKLKPIYAYYSTTKIAFVNRENQIIFARDHKSSNIAAKTDMIPIMAMGIFSIPLADICFLA